MKVTSFEYIEVFYVRKEVPLGDKRKRQHSSLGYRSPIQFLENWFKEQQQKTDSMKSTLWQIKYKGEAQ